jgi:hypothetical protein
MSTDESQLVSGRLGWRVGGALIVLAVGLVVLVLAVGKPSPPATQKGVETSTEEGGLDSARQSLVKDADLTTCQAALNQINTALSEPGGPRPPTLGDGQAGALRKEAFLDAGEVEEISGGNFTRLDAHHLEACLLLRDAARALEVRGPDGSEQAAPLERAAAAFDWVVRQTRLGVSGVQTPPVQVLHRGWGSALDRALIFLALLEQVGSPDGRSSDLTGCLVFYPGKEPGKLTFWACGVVVNGGRDLYLFDPRLGLAIPGPGGKGIATLAEARSRPEVLAQLGAGDKLPYDVKPEQVREAQFALYCPLSALAPRMRYLQDEVLPPAVEVRLAADPAGDLARVKAAAGAGAGKEPVVQVWREGVGLLRRFLGPDEGGVDKDVPFLLRNLGGFTLPTDDAVVQLGRRQLFQLELVPWPDLPPQFQDNKRFPYNIGLGLRVRNAFARPFTRATLEPGMPRDLLLRGQVSQAAKLLVEERDQWEEQRRQRETAGPLDAQVNEWVEKAISVYAQQLRARTPEEQEQANRAVAELWNKSQAVTLLLNGAVAGARGADIIYQLGLCTQERAERLQARLDLLARPGGDAPTEADREKAQAAWSDALGWWKQYTEQHAGAPGQAQARRLRGRAQAMLGDRQGAAASWREQPEGSLPWETLAGQYLARQLDKQHAR